jgi:UDP-N-acetylglucosamine transferase subunit ALG13
MILVTVGTNEAKFDRLVSAFDDMPIDEPIVVQHGSSGIRPKNATCVDFLSFENLVGYIREARVVVAHAGVGTIMTVAAQGKRPFVVPRLHRHGEAVDDHQCGLGQRFHEIGLVTYVEDPSNLAELLAADEPLPQTAAHASADRLSRDLRAYLAELAPEQSFEGAGRAA